MTHVFQLLRYILIGVFTIQLSKSDRFWDYGMSDESLKLKRKHDLFYWFER